ncbi:MAG: hypothetical protein K0R90_179 [Oscillospiraceae bacterium]|jgi:hypothetical protein|nr:hypothetical protein [Oscillospiraceae bacterium]
MNKLFLILVICLIISCFAGCGVNKSNALIEKTKVSMEETQEEKVITREQAVDMLNTVPKEKLSLPVPLKEYKIVFDDSYTQINRKNFYGINAFVQLEGGTENMGVFFVATDGSAMYKINSSNGEYVALTN